MKKKVITVMTALSLMVCTLCTNAVKASAYNGYNAASMQKNMLSHTIQTMTDGIQIVQILFLSVYIMVENQ